MKLKKNLSTSSAGISLDDGHTRVTTDDSLFLLTLTASLITGSAVGKVNREAHLLTPVKFTPLKF